MGKSKSSVAKSAGRSARDAGLTVNLTVRYRFGDDADDRITVIDQRPVPMVNSVFDNRDRIIRQFAKLMIVAGLKSPRVMRELSPWAALTRRSGR